jgi:hypothetical protein
MFRGGGGRVGIVSGEFSKSAGDRNLYISKNGYLHKYILIQALTKKENEELSNKSMSPCLYYLLYNPKKRFLCSRIKKKIKLERNQKAIRGERYVGEDV